MQIHKYSIAENLPIGTFPIASETEPSEPIGAHQTMQYLKELWLEMLNLISRATAGALIPQTTRKEVQYHWAKTTRTRQLI